MTELSTPSSVSGKKCLQATEPEGHLGVSQGSLGASTAGAEAQPRHDPLAGDRENLGERPSASKARSGSESLLHGAFSDHEADNGEREE